MRRGVTVLVVVVVAAIALAAGIDTLRGGDDAQPAAQTEPEPPSVSIAAEPATSASELTGTLYYTDGSCELQAIELPEQTPVEAPGWDECLFVLSPTGQRVAGPGSGWDTYSDPRIGRLFQSEDGVIQVATKLGPDGEPFEGEAPAWRPDGTLTYFADGAVRTWPDGEVVLSQSVLLRALRQTSIPGLAGFRRVRVREAAWLEDGRLATILSVEGPSGSWDVLTSFEEGRVQEAFVESPGRFADLRASPAGTYLAARRGQDGPIIAEPDRGEIGNLGITEYRAIAFSPDEQWVAVAAESGVFVFRAGVAGPPELELDLYAHDLAWRGEAGPPPIADADQAREWLGEAGATGRLVVTLADGSDCALRALQLPDLEWAPRPLGLPSPCRFTLDENDEVLVEKAVPQPGGDRVAVCQNSTVNVFNDEGFLDGYPGACAPAWRPDGRLTFIRGGGLFEPTRRLLSRRDVGEMFGRTAALQEVAWVDDERFWAVVRSGESAAVALMTIDRLVFSSSVTWAIEDLRVSATGMVAARTDQGVVFFDSAGRRTLTFPNGQTVAWAPGELFAAVATPSEVLFVAPISREVVTLPLAVKDLEWVVP